MLGYAPYLAVRFTFCFKIFREVHIYVFIIYLLYLFIIDCVQLNYLLYIVFEIAESLKGNKS